MAVDISKHLERAKRFLERNRVEDAIEAYQAALEAAPSNQEAMQALGDLHVRLNQPERAASYYTLLFDSLTDSRDEGKAAALYSRFLRSYPQPPERMARFALLLQKQQKTEEAIEQYQQAAEAYLAKRNPTAALSCWERIAQLDPDDAENHLHMGELGEQLAQPAVAVRGYLRAGQLALAGGEAERALEFFARAHRLAPADRSVALLFADAQVRQGAPAEAVKLLEPLSASGTDAGFLELFGTALMQSGELDRAREMLEKLFQTKPERFAPLFELADAYAKAGNDAGAVDLLARLKMQLFAQRKENEFTAELDRLAEAHPNSAPLVAFWGGVYNELNREAKYFDILVRLFDLQHGAGNLEEACETLDRLVDIDAYDFRNQQRLEQLQGRVDGERLSRIAARLSRPAAMGPEGPVVSPSLAEREVRAEAGSAPQALEDLMVQAEIFLQYSLHAKAVERLEKIAEMFPDEEERNERLRNLYELAHWWPAGSKSKPAPTAEPVSAGKTAVSSPETLRDLSAISEVNHGIFRQSTPRSVLSFAANEVGKYLKATRCLAVIGVPGQPPQMAAEFCAPGVGPSSGGLIVKLLAQLERAAPDSLGGLPLDAAAAPVMREMGLETVLGVQLSDRETQAPAGMIVVGHAAPHKWKPNETYFLQAVGDQMLLYVNHTRLRSLVRTLAVADEKTGLLARSSYADCLMGEAQRARSQGTPLSLAILQLDRGPELLRQKGEAAVERHMEQLARALQPLVRQNDIAVKYTAWSLALILPDTTLAGARTLVEKLRRVAARVRPPWDTGQLSVSVVVAEAITRPDFENEDIVTEVINRAEASLEETRGKGGGSLVLLEHPRS